MVEHGTILPTTKGVGSHRTAGFGRTPSPTIKQKDLQAYINWLAKNNLKDDDESRRAFTQKGRFML
ncbi:hypothetical protein KKH36_03865 [Patescibacteria group bacterium]|nr:hypothetical protein [Patescibacteria group bacterium]